MDATEKKRLYDKEYYQRNKGRKKEYYQQNRGKILQYQRTSEKNKQYNLIHRDIRMARAEAQKLNQKIDVLTYYGGGKLACVKCGFDNIHALSIDHINGGGGQHRNRLSHNNFYRWLQREGYPTGYQTLCMNCQFIKRFEGRENRWHKKS